LQYDTYESLLKSEEILKLYENEINTLVNIKNGFKMFERINKFALITKPFEVGVELSAKQEVMRFRINEIYKKEISEMFADAD
jgi:long-chain acyl-CoA synthetase